MSALVHHFQRALRRLAALREHGDEPAEIRALRSRLDQALGPDGAPKGDPEVAVVALLDAFQARAELIQRGIAFPPDLDSLLVSGSNALSRLLGEQDGLPGPLASTAPRAPGPRPGPWALHDAARAITGEEGLEEPAPLAGDRPALWTWRATGLCVAHARVLQRPSRVFLDACSGWLQWDMPGLGLLAGGVEREDGRLAVSRVDGRKLRMVASGRDQAWTRDVLVQGARLIARDRGLAELSWRLHPGLVLEETPEGWTGRGGDLSLEIKVERAWRWRLEGTHLTGTRGDGPPEVQTSLELRN